MFSFGTNVSSESTSKTRLTSFLQTQSLLKAPSRLDSFLETNNLISDFRTTSKPRTETTRLNDFLRGVSDPKRFTSFGPPLRSVATEHSAIEKEKISEPRESVIPQTNIAPQTSEPIPTMDALRYMMNVVVTKENIKRIAVGLAITTIITVASSVAISGALWSFATFLASTSSAKAGVALATKKLKFLNRKIPQGFLVDWSEKLGLPLTKNTTYADLLEASINSSTTIATGGLTGLFITQGLKTSLAVGKAAYFKGKEVTAKEIPSLRSIPEKVIRTIADPEVEKVNLIDLAVGSVEKVSVEEKVVAPKTTRPSRRPVPKTVGRKERAKEEIFERNEALRNKTIDQSTVEVVSKGRYATYAAGLGTVLVGLAVTGTIDSSVISSAALSLVDLAKERSIATEMIAKIVATSGLNKTIEMLGLTPDQGTTLRALSAKFAKSGNDPGLIEKILSVITRGKIYGASIKKLSKAELLEAAKERGVKVPKGIDLKTLRKIVLQSEAEALAQTQMMVQTLLTGAMVSAAGNQLANEGLDLLQSVSMVNPVGAPVEIPSDPTFDATKVRQDIDFLEQTIRSSADARLSYEAAAKAAAEAQAVAEKLAKDAGIAERVAARSQNAALDRLARDAAREAARAKIAAAKAAEAARIAALPPKPVLEPREIREAALRARRELQEAARVLQNAMESGVIIVPPEGPAIGVPDAKLMEPGIQKALEDFGKITPLMNLAATKTAALGASWLEGGITQTVNNWVGVAEFTKDVYRLTKVIQDIRTGEENLYEVPDIVNEALKLRVPSLGMAVEKMLRADDVDPTTILLNALRDQAVHGADLERLYMDVGRQLLWGNDASKGIGLSDWMVRKVGSMFYHGIMG